jgi:predicted cupin superfamily sugar epimerase
MPNYVEMLNLQKHIEGGYFSVFYTSSDKVTPLNYRYNAPDVTDDSKEKPITKSAGSSIYFMLNHQAFSAWHRLKSDEIWHYYDGGSPIQIHTINAEGILTTHLLGNPSQLEGATFQVIITAGLWFAAEVYDKTSFGLVGCTVSPGFEYEDFELADKESLITTFPKYKEIVSKFISTNPGKNPDPEFSQSYKSKLTAKDYIEMFQLERHVEGGSFNSVYKSADEVIVTHERYKNIADDSDQKNIRSAGTSIYFLLDQNDYSAWHCLKSDEIWHYYDGSSPIKIHTIDEEGKLFSYLLGNPAITPNASFQVVVKAGIWLAAEIQNPNSFGLVGCTVTPGFEYQDFTLGNKQSLIQKYDHLSEIINKFCQTPLEETENVRTSFSI